ncbi:hypothetical protein ACWC24_17370 [Streptomyces sp. NPDC001443]
MTRRRVGPRLVAKGVFHPVESESVDTTLPSELSVQPRNEITE